MKIKNHTYILSLETSGATCGVALSDGAKILSDHSIYVSNQHDRLLAEFTRRTLDDADVTVDDLSAVAVSAGPGSFTGLRIGAALAKGLCYQGKPKFIPVPTLSAFAYHFRDLAKMTISKRIISAISSHKDLLYFQIFSPDMSTSSEIEMTTEEEFPGVISENDLVCGNLKFQLNDIDNQKTDIKLSPSIIADYAYILFERSLFASPETYKPLYVQEFVPRGFTK